MLLRTLISQICSRTGKILFELQFHIKAFPNFVFQGFDWVSRREGVSRLDGSCQTLPLYGQIGRGFPLDRAIEFRRLFRDELRQLLGFPRIVQRGSDLNHRGTRRS